jgi:hypothetical protein
MAVEQKDGRSGSAMPDSNGDLAQTQALEVEPVEEAQRRAAGCSWIVIANLRHGRGIEPRTREQMVLRHTGRP